MADQATATDARPEIVELAECMFRSNLALVQKANPGFHFVSWRDLEGHGRGHLKHQWIDAAQAAVAWGALDRFPQNAIERPKPVAPLYRRWWAAVDDSLVRNAPRTMYLAFFLAGLLAGLGGRL